MLRRIIRDMSSLGIVHRLDVLPSTPDYFIGPMICSFLIAFSK
jgi:hypothetical protein